MNAKRLASFSGAFIAVALAAGCATDRDERPMQSSSATTPVAAAPMVREPVTVVAVTPAPVAVAVVPADPVMTPTRPTYEPAAPYARMADNNMTERAPRADRN